MMKKFPLFYFADLKKSPTFAVHKELGSHICWPKSEKGIRCESGTIPVAVYSVSYLGSFGLLHSLPLAKAGKARQTG